MKHEAILTFPFFSDGGKLTAILTKSDTFFFDYNGYYIQDKIE